MRDRRSRLFEASVSADPVLTFGLLLGAAGICPSDVRLLRHQDTRHPGYLSPYVLWRDHPDNFESYQRTQSFGNASKLAAPIWASFVGTPDQGTLFVGLYHSRKIGPLPFDLTVPHAGPPQSVGSCDLYELSPAAPLQEFRGCLWIDWGAGYRSWIQRGDSLPKRIVELRQRFEEPDFPGFSKFILPLSDIGKVPTAWAAALGSTRGIYLLTCPRTREQYVGSASGEGGFIARWLEYHRTGHGGNVALKSRELSDYQVSILDTVADSASLTEILALEQLWKDKLQSRQMGLNRN
jgi:hypothetical protein